MISYYAHTVTDDQLCFKIMLLDPCQEQKLKLHMDASSSGARDKASSYCLPV